MTIFVRSRELVVILLHERVLVGRSVWLVSTFVLSSAVDSFLIL